jgi:chromosome segregation ATPase
VSDELLQAVRDDIRDMRKEMRGLRGDVSAVREAQAESRGVAPDVADIKTRLTNLEHSLVNDLEKRIDALEADRNRRQGAAAALGIIGGGGGAALFKLLFGG